MRIRLTQKDLRERLLKDRGVIVPLSKPHQHAKFIPVNHPTAKHKTPLMRLMEAKYGNGKSIEEMLLVGSLSEVAKLLGNEVDVTTISKWIKQLKLRFTSTNLPECKDCLHYIPENCDLGVCPLLIKLEQWDAFESKRKEILNEQGNIPTTARP